MSSPPASPLFLHHCALSQFHTFPFFFSLSPLGSLIAFSAGAWDLLLEHGQSLGAHIPKENRISLSQLPSVANTLSVRDKTFGTPAPLHAWILSGLTLHRHCPCCHSCCVFLSAADVLILEITTSLYLSITYSSYSLPAHFSVMTPEPWEERVWYRHLL